MTYHEIEIFKRKFFYSAIADILRALDGGCTIGAFILSFCLIDYMAWIEFGDVKYAFNDWINKRLIPINYLYTQKDKELYSIRCGLVHTYGPSKKNNKRKLQGVSSFKI